MNLQSTALAMMAAARRRIMLSNILYSIEECILVDEAMILELKGFMGYVRVENVLL